MTIQAFVCTSCDTTIYSRCIPDICECQCGRCSIYGGFEKPTVVVNGEPLVLPNLIAIEEPKIDADILYWDWNLMLDEYGYLLNPTHTLKSESHDLHTA